MDRKANVGLGTLILFISLLLVTAVAIGTLHQTSQSITGETSKTFSESQKQLSTNVVPQSVFGYLEDDLLDWMCMDMSLASGSEIVKLNNSILVLNLKTGGSSLSYRGVGSENHLSNKNGFNTFGVEEIDSISVYDGGYFSGNWFLSTFPVDVNLDFDGDGVDDSIELCGLEPQPIGNCPYPYNGSYIAFRLTAEDDLFVPLRNEDGSLARFESGTAGAFSVRNERVGDYAYINGARSDADSQEAMSFLDTWNRSFGIYLKPYDLEEDLDDDGHTDTLQINSTHAWIKISSVADPIVIPFNVPVIAGNTLDVDSAIENDGVDYGQLVVSGVVAETGTIGKNVEMKVIPANRGYGYFSAVYTKKSDRFQEGLLQDKDLVNVCFQTPYGVDENELIHIKFITEAGKPIELDFKTPDVFYDDVIQLFP